MDVAALYLVINIELYVLWQWADVSSWSAVVVHHCRDSRIVQCLWDPFELHRSHVVFPFQKTPPTAAATALLPDFAYISYLTVVKTVPPRLVIQVWVWSRKDTNVNPLTKSLLHFHNSTASLLPSLPTLQLHCRPFPTHTSTGDDAVT